MLSDNAKFIIGILAGIGIVLGFVWAAQPSASLSASQTGNGGAGINAAALIGKLAAEEQSFDFGTISMAKGKVSHAFKVKNTGNEPVPVGKIYTSCMCTQVTMTKGGEKWGPFGMPGHVSVPSIDQTLAPGEEVELEAIFDPAAHGPAGVGTINRQVFMETNGIKIMQLGFSANVTP